MLRCSCGMDRVRKGGEAELTQLFEEQSVVGIGIKTRK